MLLQAHDQFRRAADVLVERPGPERRHLFRRLVTVLRHHHHAEEVGLFPLVRRHIGDALDTLVDDHAMLDEAVASAAGQLTHGDPTEALMHLRTVLNEHLDREEALVVPVLLRLSPSSLVP